jgi:hypothetical protein
MKSARWKKVPEAAYPEIEAFLKSREALCMNACSRFLARSFNPGHIWTMPGIPGRIAATGKKTDTNISAFMFNSRLSLFPIFTGDRNFPLPRFLDRFLHKIPI